MAVWRIGQGSIFTYLTFRRSEFESQRRHTVFPRIIAVPQIIASLKKLPPFDGNIWNNRLPSIIPPPTLSPSSLPFILSLSSWREIWCSKTISVIIQALKINQGTKFGTLKKPMFSLFDVIIFLFNGIIKQNI